MKNIKVIKVQIEIECAECGGTGLVYFDDAHSACSGCDNTGYQTDLITLAEFKKLLEAA